MWYIFWGCVALVVGNAMYVGWHVLLPWLRFRRAVKKAIREGYILQDYCDKTSHTTNY